MKIVYVTTESLSNYRSNLPPFDARDDWSYAAGQARRVTAKGGGYRIECWRPERTLTRELTVRDEQGIIHRVFPSKTRFGFEYSRPLIKELKRTARQGGMLVEVHGLYGHLLSYAIPRLIDLPVIGQSHGWFPASSATPKTWRSRLILIRLARNWLRNRSLPQGLVRELYERRAFPRYRHLFAASSNEHQALRALHPLARASIRPMGLDFDQYRPIERWKARADVGLPNDEEILLFVGRLEKAKGLHHLIDALPSIRGAHPRARLLLIGEGSLRQELMRRVRELGVDSMVSFLGFIHEHQLPTWYSASDVFVLPSLGEACSLVCREAMACGTPVVLTDVGGSRDIAREFECGVVVPPRDPGALAGAVDAVLRKTAEFRPNIGRGRAAFGWDAFVEERHQLYAQLFQEIRGP